MSDKYKANLQQRRKTEHGRKRKNRYRYKNIKNYQVKHQKCVDVKESDIVAHSPRGEGSPPNPVPSPPPMPTPPLAGSTSLAPPLSPPFANRNMCVPSLTCGHSLHDQQFAGPSQGTTHRRGGRGSRSPRARRRPHRVSERINMGMSLYLCMTLS